MCCCVFPSRLERELEWSCGKRAAGILYPGRPHPNMQAVKPKRIWQKMKWLIKSL